MMSGHRAGLAGGLYGTFIQLGCSLGPSLATIGLRQFNGQVYDVHDSLTLCTSLDSTGYIAQAHAHDHSSVPSVPYDDPSFPASSYLYGLQRASWILAALCLFGKQLRVMSKVCGPLIQRTAFSWCSGALGHVSTKKANSRKPRRCHHI